MIKITKDELIEMFEDSINEQGEVVIYGRSFIASRVLKEMDEVAYLCGLNNFYDYLAMDGYFCEEME